MGNVKKYHFLYKTTNLKNGKFYIGVHSSSVINDDYMGSGYRLRYAIKKYGIENFKREVLEMFENRKLMFLREAEVVDDQLLKNPMCMNITLGGRGGWSSEQQRQNAIKSNEAQKWLRENDKQWAEKRISKLKENGSNNLKQAWKDGKITHFNWTGKTHTEETKQKMSEAKKGKGTGKDNSQFGTMWITNGNENKKIKKEEIIPIGWKKGRK